MTDDGKVTCPQATRTINYRKIQIEWRKRPEYKEKSAAFLKKNPWCEVWLAVGVHVPATEIHHPNRWSYQHGFEVYVDFENNGAMAVSGNKGGGHYACHNFLKVCPICKKKKCNIHSECCKACHVKKYPAIAAPLEKDEDQKRISRNFERRKGEHPCGNHRLSGICKLSKIDSRCIFSPSKALKPVPVGCPQAVAKMGARA